MNLGITNRLALVTGSSRGIGRGIAMELAREGARVILVARSAEALEAVRRELPEPDRHHAFAIDLMAEGGIDKLVESVGKLGDLDIMVHNLGGSLGISEVFAHAADWNRVWQFNVGICHELNRLLCPPMIKRQWGRIVHVSSRAADLCTGNAAYASAKAALNAYVKSVGRTLAKDKVILSAVAPGAIYIEGRYFAKMQKENPKAIEEYYDDHLPIRRLGTTKDVGGVVAFLCSEYASFMPAVIVAVDGGGL